MSKAQPDPSTGNNDGTAKKPVPCELTTAFMAEDLEALAVILTVDAGYRKLSELGSDEDSVRKNIVKQAGKKYPKGEIERAVSVCTAALPSTKPMLDLPEVPDGEEMNLDQPTIKVKDINYAIPVPLSAQWQVAARASSGHRRTCATRSGSLSPGRTA